MKDRPKTSLELDAALAALLPELAKKPAIDRNDKESYNAYMREYMRGYRRRQAEAKTKGQQ